MIVLMRGAAEAERRIVRENRGSLSAAESALSARLSRDPVRRPVGREDLADQVVARAPCPTWRESHDCERLSPIMKYCPGGIFVAELIALWLRRSSWTYGSSSCLPVDVDVAVAADEPDLDRLARKADQPLHERPARAALDLRLRRRLEDDDLAPPWVAEVVEEPVREHAVGEPRLAAGRGPRAVERRLHRGRRDPVGLTTNALTSSTIATAPTIVTIQSIATRRPCGSPRVNRSTGLRDVTARRRLGVAGLLVRRNSHPVDGVRRRLGGETFTPRSGLRSAPVATRSRSARGSPRGARRAPSIRGILPVACSAGTRGHRRGPPRSSRARPSRP